MAVNTFSEHPLVAEKDIICYKAIYYNKCNKTWESKNRQQVFVYEPLPGDKFRCLCQSKLQAHRINSEYFRAGTGAIHTYADLKSVWYNVSQDYRFNDNRWKIIIYKCFIPAGAEYYKSDDYGDSYMSRDCVIAEKIKRYPRYQVICTCGTEQIAFFDTSNKADIFKRAKSFLKDRDENRSGIEIRTRTRSEFILYKNFKDKK